MGRQVITQLYQIIVRIIKYYIQKINKKIIKSTKNKFLCNFSIDKLFFGKMFV